MKKSLVLAMAMALGVTASAYAANPFSDVPAGHWAYDSISKLAAAGIIEGYGDDTFRGDRLMTRYEMAQIVAKAMAKGANVDKLASEFADELDKLGVRVSALEKKADNVKITGQIRLSNQTNKVTNAAGATNKTHRFRLRTRLWFAGKVNDNWTYRARVENTQDFYRTNTNVGTVGEEGTAINRAYLDGRLGGVFMEAGHTNLVVGESNVYDSTFDGIIAKYGKKVRVGAYYGKPVAANEDFASGNLVLNMDRAFGVNLGVDLGKAATLGVAYDRFDAMGDNPNLNILSASLNGTIANKLGLGFLYLHTSSNNLAYIPDGAPTNGFVVKADYGGATYGKVNSWGIGAKYFHMPAGAQIAHGWTYDLMPIRTGTKGYMVYGNWTFAKNMRWEIEWSDVKSRIDDRKRKALWNEVQLRF